MGAAGRGFTGGNLRAAIAGAARLAENKEENFHIDGLTSSRFRSSPQFDQMAEAAKKMAQIEKDLLAAPIPPTAYNLRLREIDATMETLRTSNDAYLAKKMAERKAASLEELRGKNDYEQARIEHAKKIKEFVDAYKKPPALTGEDLAKMNEQDKAEFHIASQQSEMHDLQEAYRLLAEFHKQHGKPDPEMIHRQNLGKLGKKSDTESQAEDPAAGVQQ